MKSQSICKAILAGMAIFVVLACNGTFTIGGSTPAPAPLSPTTAPTPAGLVFVISPLNTSETGQNQEYTINTQTPAILENNDPRALAFNHEMQTIVQSEINDFKKAASENPRDPASGAYSLDVKYNLLFQNGAIASLKFEIQGYTGGAHPYLNIRTATYDLPQSRQVTLSDLFLPSSNYLEVISNYCITELRKRFNDFDAMGTRGAAPTPENYDHWNITPEGLLITFGVYQVAPGASGPQTVLIPYSELKSVINPQGYLADFAR